MEVEMFKKRQLRNKGEFKRDVRSQAIFLGSNCKTLIVLSQGFWEDEVTGTEYRRSHTC